MILRSKLNMADTWAEEVEARLIISWQKFPLIYDVADKKYLSNVLKERAYREIAEELNTTGSVCVKCTIILPNLKLYDAGVVLLWQ